MGLFSFFSDISSSLSITEAHAEAPDANKAEEAGSGKGDAGVRGGSSTKTPASGTPEESGEEAEVNKADAEKQKGKGGEEDGGHRPGSKQQDGEEEEGGEEEPEEEEEEEEEPVDAKESLEEECANSSECAPAKHHYDECVERVTKQQEENDGKANEDCVEEFFHLTHCATQCAAPKLWHQLK